MSLPALVPLAAGLLLAQTDLSRLANAELIERLPDVANEIHAPALEAWLAWIDAGRPAREGEREPSPVHPAVLELRRRLEEPGALTDAEWRRALVETGALRFRRRWPEGEPFAVSLRLPTWLPPRTSVRVDAGRDGWRAADAQLGSHWCGNCAMAQEQRHLYHVLGPLPAGRQQVGLDVSIGRRAGAGEDGTMWRGRIAFDVEVVPGFDAVLPPVDDEPTRAAVRDALGVRFESWREDGRLVSRAQVVLDLDPAHHPVLVGTAVSLRVEVLRRGEVVDRAALRVPERVVGLGLAALAALDLEVGGFGSAACADVPSLPAELEWDAAARAGWALRVRGVSDGVLRDWGAVRRWDGELLVPLDEAARRHEERVRAALDARLERNRGR